MADEDAHDDALEGRLDVFVSDCASALIGEVPGGPEAALLFALLWRIDPSAGGSGHAISANAVAASLVRPYETVRRRAGRLVEAGLAEPGERGFRIGAASAGRAAVLALAPRLLSALADLRTPGGGSPGGDAEALGVALDLLLGITACRGVHDTDWTTTTIIAAIGAAGPGMSIHGIARTIGLPYATVWRHIRGLSATGRLNGSGGRYRVAPDWQAGGPATAVRQEVAARTRALLARLPAPPAARRVAA